MLLQLTRVYHGVEMVRIVSFCVLAPFEMLSHCSYAGGVVPMVDVVIAFSVRHVSLRDSSRIIEVEIIELARSFVTCGEGSSLCSLSDKYRQFNYM
jgi:hypothetical protein